MVKYRTGWQLRNVHPWRYREPDWADPEQTDLTWRLALPWGSLNSMTSRVPFQPESYYSTVKLV